MEQESVILGTEVLRNSKSMLQDKVLTIGNKIFTPIRSHHLEIELTEVEMIEDSNQEISTSEDSLCNNHMTLILYVRIKENQ